MDKTGKLVFPYGKFPCAFSLCNGVFVNGVSEEDWTYSLFDLTGKQVLSETYPYLDDFYGGYAIATLRTEGSEHRRAIIDTKGNIVLELPAAFNALLGMGGGIFDYEERTETALYSGDIGRHGDGLCWFYFPADVTGNIKDAILPEDWYDISTGVVGYMDLQGNVKIPGGVYDYVYPFMEGLACVSTLDTDLFGYIDATGKMVIAPQYHSAFSFRNGYAYVENSDGKWGYIDPAGKTVIPLEYDKAYGAASGLFTVGKYVNGVLKFGAVDADNQVVVPFEYDDICSFEEGVGYAVKDGCVYILNLSQAAPEPEKPTEPATSINTGGNDPAKEGGTAVEKQDSLTLNGKAAPYMAYALRTDAGDTNYIKLRDLAFLLKGTGAEFSISQAADKTILVNRGETYEANGSEMQTPFTGEQAYAYASSTVQVNGQPVELQAFTLGGGGYTYFKLKDIAKALDFSVAWVAGTGIVVDTSKPYAD